MVSSIWKQASKIMRRRKNDKRKQKAFWCMAAVVAAGTVGLLMVTGEALTHKEKVLQCIVTPHEHTEDCFEDGNLICGQTAYAHTHNDDCYDSDGVLVCELPELSSHVHDDSCFESDETLVCEIPEGDGGHVHEEDCYTEEQTLLCGLEEDPESEDGHVHGEECRGTEQILSCEISEGNGGHVHGEDCRQKEEHLICEKMEMELEEHVHGAECFRTVELTEEKVVDENEEKFRYDCGSEEHMHDEICYDGDGELICGLEEHTHDESCLTEEKTVYDCGLEEHVHDETCCDGNGELLCGLEEHTHDENCLTEEKTVYDGDIRLEAEAEGCLIVLEASREAFPDVEGELTLAAERIREETEEYQVASQLVDAVVEQEERTAEAEQGEQAPEEESGIEAFAEAEEKEEDDCPFIVKVDGEAVDTAALLEETGMQEEAGESEEPDTEEVSAEKRGQEEEDGELEEADRTESGRLHELFDIRVLSESGEVQPAVPVKVSFIRKETEETPGSRTLDGAVRIFHVDTETEVVEAMEVTADENGNAVIETPHFSNYDVTFSVTDAAGNTSNEIHKGTVSWWHTLVEWINDGSKANGKTIELILQKDMEVKTVDGNVPPPMWIDSGRSVILDLHGHKIKFGGQISDGMQGCFIVGHTEAPGYLTIKDTGENRPTVTVEELSGCVRGAGEGAGYDYDRQECCYYYTESAPVVKNSLTGKNTGTTENTYKYTLKFKDESGNALGGAIENTADGGSAQALISIGRNGHLTIEGGRFTNRYGSVIKTKDEGEDKEINLKGGYFVGNTGTSDLLNGNPHGMGGAVFIRGKGSLRIEGDTLLAANQCAGIGGAVFFGAYQGDGAVFTINGGRICSNKVTGSIYGGNGGGIYAEHGVTLTITGGSVTNNEANQGGGGVCVHYGGSFVMNGGTIASNRAAGGNGGGGLLLGNLKSGAETGTASITAGTISNNEASVEGGGIRLNSGFCSLRVADDSSSTIFITNNETKSALDMGNGTIRHDWGGGGIFVSDNGGQMQIYRTLLTDNEADGFGGGLGGCSTGRLVSLDVVNGAAVYGNRARGDQMSGGGSAKSQDHDAKGNPVFMEREDPEEEDSPGKYQDVFSALNCFISQRMLSGDYDMVNPARWIGSSDYERIPEYDEATGMPLEIVSSRMMGLTSKAEEQERKIAEEAANVFITGNRSGTHGGGIMCNGLLLLGESREVYYPEGLSIHLQKELLDENGEKLPLGNGQFEFQLLTIDEKTEIAKVSNVAGTNAAGTNVQLVLNYSYEQVPETQENGYAEYVYCLKERIPDKVTVDEDGLASDGVVYDLSKYRITVRVRKNDDRLYLGGGNGGIYLDRHWVYILNQNTAMGDGTTADGVTVEKWVPYYCKNGEGHIHTSACLEKPENGVIQGYDYIMPVEVTADGLGDYGGSTSHHGAAVTLKEGSPLFTNVTGGQIPLWIRKTDKMTGNVMQYIEFTLTRLDDSGRKLTLSAGDADQKNGPVRWVADTDTTGIFSYTLPNVKGRNYLLEEKTQEGYVSAGPWYVRTEGNGRISVWLAEEKSNGVCKPGEKVDPDGAKAEEDDGPSAGWETGGTETNAWPLLHIENQAIRFVLPETGGAGRESYREAGLALVFLAVTIGAYLRRRKAYERRSKGSRLA